MVKRGLETGIIESLKQFPVVGLLGSRQVGKTTLAKQIRKKYKESVYLDLELPADELKLRNPELFLREYENRLVIVDEVQRMPSLFPLLRALVDMKNRPGRFLILGSAGPVLARQSSESLAGRIRYHELSPFNIGESGQGRSGIMRNWLRGGYPKSYLAPTNRKSRDWRDAFIRTFLERDLPQLGVRVPGSQLRRFWTMLAHNHAQLWNASQLSKSLGVTYPTVQHYLDILEDTFVIRRLQPYHHNLKKRLVKSPKIYIRDTGLLHALLNINDTEDLHAHPVAGHSWEGFVIEQVLSLVPDNWHFNFYRTASGTELDLVVYRTERDPIGIEIKFSDAPHLSKGNRQAFNDLKCGKGFIVYPGKDRYPAEPGITVLPITELDKIFN